MLIAEDGPALLAAMSQPVRISDCPGNLPALFSHACRQRLTDIPKTKDKQLF